MREVRIILSEQDYARLKDAAGALRLTHKQFARAILAAALGEWERWEGRVLPAEGETENSQGVKRYPQQEGGMPRCGKQRA